MRYTVVFLTTEETDGRRRRENAIRISRIAVKGGGWERGKEREWVDVRERANAAAATPRLQWPVLTIFLFYFLVKNLLQNSKTLTSPFSHQIV